MDNSILARILCLQAEMFSRVAEMEGMKAENMQRESLGHSMAYVAVDFDRVSNDLSSIATSLHELGYY